MKYINILKTKLYLLFTILSFIMLNINYLQAQTVSVCDNGGFEQDFLHYTGETSFYRRGSNSCTPTDFFNVDATFKSDSFDLPAVSSNAIEVCESKYIKYSYTYNVGSCNDNGTSDDISDDYYFVYVDLDTTVGKDWTIDRQLYDPYPNEIDEHEIANGNGNQKVILGPFRIQEGDWKMTITFNDTCTFETDIVTPGFCSGCAALGSIEIINITYIQKIPTDKWSYDIHIAGSGNYNIQESGTNILGSPFSYGSTHTIEIDPISSRCKNYLLEDAIDADCNLTFTICPPKQCSNSCNLEVYEKDVLCTNINNIVYFDVQLEVSGPSNRSLCYSLTGIPPLTPLPSNQKLGTFTQDVEITILLCDLGGCTSNCTDCFKTIYVPLTDCIYLMPVGSEDLALKQSLKVYPNPLLSNELTFESTQSFTEFEIFDAVGNLILKDYFVGKHYKLDFRGSSGLYIVRYKNSDGQLALIRLIKI